jgi:hypothetical protein
VDPTRVGMAVLVHHSFPDDIELANGVATLERGQWSSLATLVSQIGAVSVTNPDGLSLPEVVDVELYEIGAHPTPREGSSLLPLGDHVLVWDTDYQAFTDLFGRVADRYAAATGTATFVLDYEYKKIQPDRLIVKQVRPLPMPDTTLDVVPYLVGDSVSVCTFQGEASDPFAIHRLKSSWLLTAEGRWISNLTTSFWAHAEIDRVSGSGTAHLAGRPSTFAGAAYTHHSEVVTDSFTIPGATWSLQTGVVPLVRRSDAPVVVPGHFTYGLTATYAVPVPVVDWTGPTTRTEDYVVLTTICPEETVLGPGDTLVEDSIDGPAGLHVATSYYWPPPPTGPTAGYTAPLIKWGETIISGLTSTPITLRGFDSQTYRPAHHNFGAEYIFEPRLEPGLSGAILAELEAANIQLIYLSLASEAPEVWILGLDGILRRLE